MKALPLLLVALGVGGLSQPTETSPKDPLQTSPKPSSTADPRHCAPCEVKVVLKEKAGVCEAVEPSKTHKVGHVAVGDPVRWVVQNDCPVQMSVGVDRFRLHPKETCTVPSEHAKHEKEAKDANPLDPQCASKSVPVPAHGSAIFECRVKPNALHPRTYAYDIVSPVRAYVDPEMEIFP
jgi:hypothetical protein